MLENVTSWLQEFLGISAGTLSKVFLTVVLLIAAAILRKIVLKVILRHTDEPRARYNWQKGITYTVVAIGSLLLFRIWFEGLRGLDTIIGLFSAGLAIALKDIVESFFAWIFILMRRPFRVGDRISIDEYSGDVIDIRVFQFTLMEIGNWVDADQSTGRVLHVPNGLIFHKVVANFSSGFEFIWNEIPVLITFESDWKKAKEILDAVANDYDQELSTNAEAEVRKASEKYMIFYRKFKPKIYTEVRDSGVLLTIRYLTSPKTRRSSGEHIWETILNAFAEQPSIDFAYPTTRLYYNQDEDSTRHSDTAGSDKDATHSSPSQHISVENASSEVMKTDKQETADDFSEADRKALLEKLKDDESAKKKKNDTEDSK